MSVDTILLFSSGCARGQLDGLYINKKNAFECDYVALCDENEDESPGFKEVFVVAKIREIKQDTNSPNRKTIVLGDFAYLNHLVELEDFRNPIKYTSLSDLGINKEELNWCPLEEQEVVEPKKPVRALTIPEVKLMLAESYNLNPEDILITIKA